MVLPFFCGSSAISSTRPTTSGPVTAAPWISSSSMPTRTRSAASWSAVRPTGSSTWSASQAMGMRGMSDHSLELQREARVALDDVVHVGDAVAQHQGALEAHAEREARVLLGVHPARAQHVGVDHAATTPLDPAGTALLLREPQVHLGARLGEG